MTRRLTLTALAEPTPKLKVDDLSQSQLKVLKIVEENRRLIAEVGVTLKHGVIFVGPWGGGKSQTLRTLASVGLLKDDAILERGQIYEWVTRDLKLERETTRSRLLQSIAERAEQIGDAFVALDNPDIPVGSMVSEEGAYSFTWYLLEQATFGKLPYLIVTLNEFTFKRFEDERPQSLAKLSQHFDIVRLKWSAEELARAVERRLSAEGIRVDPTLAKLVARFARTPRSAIYLYIKAMAQGKRGPDVLWDLIAEGLAQAYNKYVEMLSQPGYKLSKASSRRWVDAWRMFLEDPETRELVKKLVDKNGVSSRELNRVLGRGYKVEHWPITAAMRCHIIERPSPMVYRFTDEFMAAAVEYAVGAAPTAEEVLRNMAELYGRLPRRK